jgi:hypothetical protein
MGDPFEHQAVRAESFKSASYPPRRGHRVAIRDKHFQPRLFGQTVLDTDPFHTSSCLVGKYGGEIRALFCPYSQVLKGEFLPPDHFLGDFDVCTTKIVRMSFFPSRKTLLSGDLDRPLNETWRPIHWPGCPLCCSLRYGRELLSAS